MVSRGISLYDSSLTIENYCQGLFLCHRKLRPMTQKRFAGCALARRRNMSQAVALGARMCQGTFFLVNYSGQRSTPMCACTLSSPAEQEEIMYSSFEETKAIIEQNELTGRQKGRPLQTSRRKLSGRSSGNTKRPGFQGFPPLPEV